MSCTHCSHSEALIQLCAAKQTLLYVSDTLARITELKQQLQMALSEADKLTRDLQDKAAILGRATPEDQAACQDKNPTQKNVAVHTSHGNLLGGKLCDSATSKGAAMVEFAAEEADKKEVERNGIEKHDFDKHEVDRNERPMSHNKATSSTSSTRSSSSSGGFFSSLLAGSFSSRPESSSVRPKDVSWEDMDGCILYLDSRRLGDPEHPFDESYDYMERNGEKLPMWVASKFINR